MSNTDNTTEIIPDLKELIVARGTLDRGLRQLLLVASELVKLLDYEQAAFELLTSDEEPDREHVQQRVGAKNAYEKALITVVKEMVHSYKQGRDPLHKELEALL